MKLEFEPMKDVYGNYPFGYSLSITNNKPYLCMEFPDMNVDINNEIEGKDFLKDDFGYTIYYDDEMRHETYYTFSNPEPFIKQLENNEEKCSFDGLGRYYFSITEKHVHISVNDDNLGNICSVFTERTEEMINSIIEFLKDFRKNMIESKNFVAIESMKNYIDRNWFDRDTRNKYFQPFYDSGQANEEFKKIFENPFYYSENRKGYEPIFDKKRVGQKKCKSSRKCVV